MQDKVSVIIPIYKVESYLDRCVTSIVNQTYKNLEIILVDDGSPDDCPKMCDEWAKKDERIIVIHKENGGLSDARNAGLEICTGEYVTFVDSDDYVNLNFVQKLYDIAINKRAEVVSCLVQRFSKEPKFNEEEEIIETYNKNQAILNSFKAQKYEFIVAWGKLYKRSLFNEIRYPYGKIHEDEFIIHRVFDKITTFAVTNQKLYYYYENPESITGVGYRIKRIDYLDALRDRTAFFKEKYPEIFPDMAMFYAYKCIDLYFEIPKEFSQKKLAQKLTKEHFKKAKKLTKEFKHKARNRFLIFSISPSLYKRIF